ncbi:MAG: endonuclease III domain-containing protein [Candidatus Micrarchaeia archaeon]
MNKKNISFKKLHKILDTKFNFDSWWPGDTKDEIFIGAILTQNTNWKNVEKAVFNLKEKGLLSLTLISKCNLKELEHAIKPSGFYHQKALRLKNSASYIITNYTSLDNFFMKDTQLLRKELLSLNGIGPETADSILLYCANKPIFVIDAYTKRITKRVFGNNEELTYEDLQSIIHNEITPNAKEYKKFHGELVELAKTNCKKEPTCTNCPINQYCIYFLNEKKIIH